MNEIGLAAAVDDNYWESFRLIAKACGGEVLDEGGVLSVATGVPVAMLNIAFVRRPLASPRDALTAAIDFFDRQRLPFVVRVREGIDAIAEEAAEAMGMPYSDTVPGMALCPIPEPPPGSADLKIVNVRDDKMLSQFQRVLAEGFGMPLEIAEQLIVSDLSRQDGVELYLGLAGGRAVAASTLVLTGSTAGIYNVATVNDFRRRGIGEAMTWHCVSRGLESGCSVAVLQASSMGQPVYERMGFRTVAPYRTFRRMEQA
jgi:ribosomal protein S18 acetylase RimI-like enzyme